MAAGRVSRRRSALSRARLPPPSYKMEPPRRLSLLAGASSGRAVAASSIAAASPPPASPPFHAETTGDASPLATSGIGATVLPPAGCCPSSERRPTSPSPSSVPWHRLLPRPHLGFAGTPPCRHQPLHPPRRSPPAARSSSLVYRSATAPPPPASQRQGRPRPRLPFDQTPPRSIVVVSVRSRRRRPVSRRLVVSRRRLRRRHRSGVFHAILASVQPLPAALVASSPAPVVVVVVLSSLPVVVAFVPPSSRSRPPPAFRQVCSSPVVVFVLGSASSSLVPAASRLRPRIAAEVVPSPFVSVVPGRLRRARSSLSFPRLVAWCRSLVRVVTVFVCPLGSRVVSTCAARVVSSGVRLSATRLG
uniref:Cell wall protein-like n=1 Tax=Oryza sativa subsp. japonica TaxID=39947 RepID=Q6Z0C3_ORYSJ|nr:hypothetical protein [Oryza sativa Japonica Group]